MYDKQSALPNYGLRKFVFWHFQNFKSSFSSSSDFFFFRRRFFSLFIMGDNFFLYYLRVFLIFESNYMSDNVTDNRDLL